MTAGGPVEVPLFPLHTVLFPDGLLPLRLFEQRYLEMAKACLRDGTPFGVCRIREGAEVGAPAAYESIGCLATIAHWDMQQLGLLQITARGQRRFRVVSDEVRAGSLIVGRVELLPEEVDAPLPEHLLVCQQLLERVAAEHGERLFAKPYRFDSAVWVGARLAEVLPLPGTAKQRLLELDGVSRLEALHQFIAQQS